MFMWRKNSRSLGIVFLLVFICSFASASDESICFEYNQNVSYGEPFLVNVSLINFSENFYDVKIDVLNSSGSRIARIFNNGNWSSTNYYVLGGIGNNSNFYSFLLNISEKYNGESRINVTIRKMGTSSPLYKFGSFSMNVSWQEVEEIEENPIVNNTENNAEDNNEIDEEIEEEIEIDLDYDDELTYGEDFSVSLNVEGIEGEYDVKISILDEDGKIISKIYDEEEDKWISGNYYLINMMEDDDEESFDLNVTKEYDGDGEIEVKIRQGEVIVKEEKFDLEIVFEDEDEDEESEEEEEFSEVEDDDGGIIGGEIASMNLIEDDNKLHLGDKKEYTSKEGKLKESLVFLSPLLLLGLLIYLIKLTKGRREKVL